MSDELYLVAHKVRGEPAFDIAIRLTIGDEEGWVIPTSGHRAYPYWSVAIYNYKGREGHYYINDEYDTINIQLPPMPPDLEDHYPSRPATEPPPTAAGILARLGLGRKPPTITRRV